VKKDLTNTKFVGMINGSRVYREARGVNHIQHPARPNEAQFTGSIREIEKASHAKFLRMR
jgi:hypothetical protein